MRSVEVEGNSRVDATRRALELLGADVDDVKVEVIKEEPRGFFGFLGFKRVTVRVTLLAENLLEQAGDIVKAMVAFLPVPVEARVAMQKNTVNVTLSGQELRQFQRQEDIADALGHVLELILNRRAGNKVTVKCGFAEDAASRETDLVSLAKAIADRVSASGREEALAPMSPRDRRTVHMTLERDGRVVTKSQGSGNERRVVIYAVAARPPAHTPEEKRGEEHAQPPSRRRRGGRSRTPKPAAGETGPVVKPATPGEQPAKEHRPRRRTRPKAAGPDKVVKGEGALPPKAKPKKEQPAAGGDKPAQPRRRRRRPAAKPAPKE